ncbi:MAG: membrane protein insertion efficiency factor YidD [Thermodesulfobacteriota bacterium]|nr:membrane protein insertion efficiency factor YidD [Thermodesulfobacteriota bacterium]
MPAEQSRSDYCEKDNGHGTAIHLKNYRTTNYCEQYKTSNKSNSYMQNRHILKFYQKYISPVDGARCPMYPGCSSYAVQAFEKHGFLMGFIMTCDRLVRCGRDEIGISPGIIINKRKFCYDPVKANDFWWGGK